MKIQEQPCCLPELPIVQITPEGIFKYILIQARIYYKDQESTLVYVRGDRMRPNHIDSFLSFIQQVKSQAFEVSNERWNVGKFKATKGDCEIFFECLGGGRIEHNFVGNKCFIYGYSNRYGAANHGIAQSLISVHLQYPLEEIKISSEGY